MRGGPGPGTDGMSGWRAVLTDSSSLGDTAELGEGGAVVGVACLLGSVDMQRGAFKLTHLL